MNRVDYLLTVLGEECAEIIQVIAKAQRFGLEDHHPEKDITNRTDLRIEFCQLLAVASMLREEGVELFNFASTADMRIMREKVAEVEHFILYSRERGRIE